MKRSDIPFPPEYYSRYIDLVEDIELLPAFANSFLEIDDLNPSLLYKTGDGVYAPGKWTIRQILQHLTDWERIFAFRTLLLARKDHAVQSSIDENLLTINSKAETKSFEWLLGELRAVRHSTMYLFSSFDNETLLTTGFNGKYEISVLAMGFTIIGHQAHHFKIIREKYLSPPL